MLFQVSAWVMSPNISCSKASAESMGEAGPRPIVVTGMGAGIGEDAGPNDAIHSMEGHEKNSMEGHERWLVGRLVG